MSACQCMPVRASACPCVRMCAHACARVCCEAQRARLGPFSSPRSPPCRAGARRGRSRWPRARLGTARVGCVYRLLMSLQAFGAPKGLQGLRRLCASFAIAVGFIRAIWLTAILQANRSQTNILRAKPPGSCLRFLFCWISPLQTNIPIESNP